jgi:hypothetical protein
MAKRISALALLVSMLMVTRPVPGAALPGPYYGPPPVYVAALVYGPRFIAPPRRVFAPAYRGYGGRSYYRPPAFRAGFRRR